MSGWLAALFAERQVLLELQVSEAPEAAPDSSVSTTGKPWFGRAAILFQFALGTTPALSVGAMLVPAPPTSPVKFTPMPAARAGTR